MTMISFTYDDGDNIATVNWTPEYGFMAAGDKAILDRISYREVEPRVPEVVPVPVLSIPMRDDTPGVTPPFVAPPEDIPVKLGCAACGCPEAAHGPDGCSRHLCRTFVQDF